MTPRQILQEILSDYRFQVKSGMPVAQALDILRQQVVSLIEYEKTLAYDRGQEAGRYGEKWETHLRSLQREQPPKDRF